MEPEKFRRLSQTMISPDREERLIQQAFSYGVSDAKIISIERIPIDAKFAGYCKKPGCSGYGMSMSCPPNVMGPEKFKKYIQNFIRIMVFKFDIPWEVLLSDDRYGVNRIIHETAANLEKFALENGFKKAKGFAGGCCKELFCSEHLHCQALFGDGTCRYPDKSRQSMSGMGVDFKALSSIVGWDIKDKVKSRSGKSSTGLMAGSVLLSMI